MFQKLRCFSLSSVLTGPLLLYTQFCVVQCCDRILAVCKKIRGLAVISLQNRKAQLCYKPHILGRYKCMENYFTHPAAKILITIVLCG